MSKIFLDHIVLGVPNLDQATDELQNLLGVKAIYGGKHVGLGTHNALLGIGKPKERIYLELLAINPEEPITNNYPLGLQPNSQNYQVLAWCIRCENFDIEKANNLIRQLGDAYDQGEVRAMQRVSNNGDVLSWRLAANPQKILTSSGKIPFLIQWDNLNQHPSCGIQESNFLDFSFQIFGPDSSAIGKNLQSCGLQDSKNLFFVNSSVNSLGLNLIKNEKGIFFGLKD